MYPIFVVDSFLFGVIGFLIVCALLIAMEFSSLTWSILISAGTLVLFEFFSDFRPISLFMHQPALALVSIFAYLMIGVVWSIGKWIFFVYDIRVKALEIRKDLELRYPDYFVPSPEDITLQRAHNKKIWTDMSGQLCPDGKAWLNEELTRNFRIHDRDIKFPLRVQDQKKRLTMWILFFPISVFWTMTHDISKLFVNFTLSSLRGFFQSISDRILKDVSG